MAAGVLSNVYKWPGLKIAWRISVSLNGLTSILRNILQIVSPEKFNNHSADEKSFTVFFSFLMPGSM
jgi:hypothetical protein